MAFSLPAPERLLQDPSYPQKATEKTPPILLPQSGPGTEAQIQALPEGTAWPPSHARPLFLGGMDQMQQDKPREIISTAAHFLWKASRFPPPLLLWLRLYYYKRCHFQPPQAIAWPSETSHPPPLHDARPPSAPLPRLRTRLHQPRFPPSNLSPRSAAHA